MPLLALIFAALLSAPPADPAGGATHVANVWFEAESADRGDFPPPSDFEFAPADAEQAGKLSGGAWVGKAGDHGGGFLEYDLDVPQAGEYRLYARKFWKHGPYRWRFEQGGQIGEWTEVGRGVALLDEATLRTHTVVNWTPAGAVALGAGPATLRVELTDEDGAAAFDAWLLTDGPFVPRGKLRPGESYDVDVPDGFFAFDPAPDHAGEPLVDLRQLNETEAGESGFVRADGDRFVRGDTGETLRFWGVNAGNGVRDMDRPSVDALADFLARRGVNLVRMHGTTYPKTGDLTRTLHDEIDRVHYFVAAMKKRGIYTCLSTYFPLWLTLDEADGWAGYDGQKPFALLYFDPKFQKIYRGWWRDLLTRENPYTGLPLARDPAVAMAEIVNEDSFFFWTFTPGDRVPAEQMPTLNAKFAEWLAGKHGSVEAAIASWDGAHDAAEVPGVSRLFNTRDDYSKDATEFLTELQRGFYEETTQYLKDDLGFGGVVYASNWTTASPRYLEPLEKHTYLAADFTDRHGYYEGVRRGEGSNYQLREGHVYSDRAAVRFDPADPSEDGPAFSLPLMNAIYGDEDGPVPAMVSEFDWAQPNRYRADLPLIASAYSLLQGLDAPVFFALEGAGWQRSLSKWPVQSPDAMGQFPAFSLIYRQGLVKEGPVAARVTAGVDRLKRLGGAPTVGTVNLDDLRAADVPEGESARVEGVESVDPRAFFVGQVRVDLMPGDAEPELETINLGEHVDESAEVIRSATGELAWDYGRGLITLDAPAAKAASGFLSAAGRIDLGGGVLVESPVEYGTIALVALDGEPIEQSGRLLLQTMTEATNFGYETADAGGGLKRIVNLGGPPLIVREFAGTVTLPAGEWQLTPLTAALTAADDAKPAESGRIELRPDVMYYLIERR